MLIKTKFELGLISEEDFNTGKGEQKKKK